MTAPDLEQRVAVLLAEHRPGASLDSFRPLPGGHSGVTCLAEVSSGAETQKFVVKATPPGRKPVGRHDVLRQARILTALAGSSAVGIPEVLVQDESDEPFFIMNWYPGDAAEPVLGEAPELSEPTLRARADGAAAMLARLHSVDPETIGIVEEPHDPLAELARWTATMATIDPELREGADEVEKALHAEPPAPATPRIVHGDYRLGNILCVGDQASTVIDWEIWSVGDIRVDLAWLLLFCEPSNFPGISLVCPMPPAHTLLTSYHVAGGESVDDLAWFDAMARYKMAAVMGNNLARHRSGRHHDPFQETLGPTIRAMIANARGLVG